MINTVENLSSCEWSYHSEAPSAAPDVVNHDLCISREKRSKEIVKLNKLGIMCNSVKVRLCIYMYVFVFY